MNILLLETIEESAFQILEKQSDIKIFKHYQTPTSSEDLKHIDAVITRGLGQVNVALMDACPKLKIAARCGVGLDNVDVKEATKRGIKVVNSPGSNANTVAEHTIALILMLQRNLYQALNDVKSGNWAARSTFKSDEVGEKTIGILGLGNIGQKVAKIADALGMKVVYWSQSKKDVPYEYVSKEELLKKSDIISIHLPLTSETEKMFDSNTFSKLKPNAILVNTARGQLIDKQALIDALNAGKLGGYGADVPTSPAPTADDSLISHPKALITAHVSSLTSTTYRNMCVSTVNNVLAILRNQPPQSNCIFNQKELNL
jgi:D-3-phosphoglycerate dehydrogenase